MTDPDSERYPGWQHIPAGQPISVAEMSTAGIDPETGALYVPKRSPNWPNDEDDADD